MSNHVKNTVYMKDIGNKPLYSYSTENGEKYLDFNKLIEMPPSLDMVEGSIKDISINETMKYLINRISGNGRDRYDMVMGPYRKMDGMINLSTSMLANEDTNRISYIYPNRSCFEAPENISYEQLLEIGMVYLRNIMKYGYATWYGWCCDNWGTKWNAYDFTQLNDDCIEFNTAWNIPEEIYIALSEAYPYNEITVDWIDEGGEEGRNVYYAGECIEEEYGKWDYGYTDEELEEFDRLPKKLFINIDRS